MKIKWYLDGVVEEWSRGFEQRRSWRWVKKS